MAPPLLSCSSVRLPFRPRGETWSQITLSASGAVVPRRPLDFVLLLDRSSSMRGAPLFAAVEAACGILDRLGPGDRFGVVTFDATAEVLIPPMELDDRMKRFLRARLEALQPGYGTNFEAAFEAAADAVRAGGSDGAVRRVLMLTDGFPSTGANDTGELGRGLQALTRRGYTLSCAGVGLGYEAGLLADLAGVGGGALHALETPEAIAALLRREVDGVQHALLSEVVLELEPDPSVEQLFVSHQLGVQRAGRKLVISLGELNVGVPRSVLLRTDARSRIGRIRVRGLDASGREAFFEEQELHLGSPDAEAPLRIASTWLGLELARALMEAWEALRHGRSAMASRLEAALALSNTVENASGLPTHPLTRRIEDTLKGLAAKASQEQLRRRQTEDLTQAHGTRVSRVVH